MNYQKTFDELLDGILTDYRNQFPEVDSSQGSLVFIKSAVLASAVWGIYKHQEYIAGQIFPDTAAEPNLERHAWVRGVDRKPGESAGDYLDRLLDVLREPPAGGNQRDFERWALEVATVSKAWSFPLAQGDGSIDVVILANSVLTGDEIPSAELLALVKAYIEERRPVRSNLFRVLAPAALAQEVVMTGVGAELVVAVAADIAAYLQNFEPGQILYPAQLQALAINSGVENPVVTTPAAAVVPAAYQMLRAGVVDVS